MKSAIKKEIVNVATTSINEKFITEFSMKSLLKISEKLKEIESLDEAKAAEILEIIKNQFEEE